MKKIKIYNQPPERYSQKPYTKDYYEYLRKFIVRNKIKNIIDIGCASGFLFEYLPKNIKGIGIDVSQILIKKAKRNNTNKNINFKNINLFIRDQKKIEKLVNKNNLKNFDLITLLGTINCIIDYENVIKQLSKLKAKKIIIHAPLNSNNFDVKISHRINPREKEVTAFNIISKKNITKLFNKFNYKVSIIPYIMKRNLNKNKKFPLRNYHIKLKNDRKIMANGLGILLNEYLVIAHKK